MTCSCCFYKYGIWHDNIYFIVKSKNVRKKKKDFLIFGLQQRACGLWNQQWHRKSGHPVGSAKDGGDASNVPKRLFNFELKHMHSFVQDVAILF